MNPLQDLYKKEMDRREFLTLVGLFILFVSGISGLIKNLKAEGFLNDKKSLTFNSFGNGAYGGAGKKV